jgi:hypothetical protein
MSVMFDRQDSLPIASGNIPLTTGTTMSQSMKSPTLQHGSEAQRLPASQKPFPLQLARLCTAPRHHNDDDTHAIRFGPHLD